MTSITVILPHASILFPCCSAEVGSAGQLKIRHQDTQRLAQTFSRSTWVEATAQDGACRRVYTFRNPRSFQAFTALVETRTQIRAVEITLSALQNLGA